MECSCCVQNKEREIERLGVSNREVLELVALPTKTERKNIEIHVCPECDGGIIKYTKDRHG